MARLKTQSKVRTLLILIAVLIIALLFVIYRPIEAPLAPIPSPTPHTDFREIMRRDASKKQVIITVNAGFGERSAEGLLTALAKHRIQATFFLVGEWVEDHPELTRRIAKKGHEIYNHSYDHRDYTTLTAEEIKADLQKMDDVLFATAGIRTRPYFRAPFGYRNEAVRQAGAEAGFQHIYWSIDSIDWREGETGESIMNRVLTHIHPGAIVLLHIGDLPTGDIADELFTTLKERGYELVSLTEALQ